MAETIYTKNAPDSHLSYCQIIIDLLDEMDISSNKKGYDYLKDAILFYLEDNTLLEPVTKKLYPKIAKKYETTPTRVMQAIDQIRKKVSSNISEKNGTITGINALESNKEFIIALTNKIIDKRSFLNGNDLH